MLKRIVLATLLCIGANSALAMAYADIDVGPFGKFRLEETAYSFLFEPVDFSSGDVDIPYTITVHDDGLTAGPIPDFCLGVHGGSCSPDNNGYELSTIELGLATRSAEGGSSGALVNLETHADAVAETFAQTGVIHISGPADPDHPLSFYALAFVASNPVSPVPEPETYAMLLIGLAAIVARRRRVAT